ncbi:hypothetical protein LRAMOSA11468 [Lichtheimia ramosa]|uniref:C2H2-type domain-containing protein n=1 Tax=Lichtheimia ramosa TaxID=688394 RepID=A0A077WX72_9FUNG|nr:hypothetical protein LRAMOSA11468 [Lichtheimia ramosa]
MPTKSICNTKQQMNDYFFHNPSVWPLDSIQEAHILMSQSYATTSSPLSSPATFDLEEGLKPSPTPSSSASSTSSSSIGYTIAAASIICTSRKQRKEVIRCKTCNRRFHSKGNLANHHQLYQH